MGEKERKESKVDTEGWKVRRGKKERRELRGR